MYDPYVRPVFVLHLFICIFAICVQFIHILTFAHRHSIYLWTILIISDPSLSSLLFFFLIISMSIVFVHWYQHWLVHF